MKEVMNLRAKGHTQKEIGKLLGVSKESVSRWISEERGGERTTFGAMLRYADALNLPYETLFSNTAKAQKKIQTITAYDLVIKNVLVEFAKDTDLTISDIAEKTGIEALEINAVFNGELPVTPTIMTSICTLIEVGESLIHKRASKKLEQERKTATAKADSTRSA
jgi:transcriptional regulator with XRE-family HTH domain